MTTPAVTTATATPTPVTPLFAPGRLVATPGALAALERAGTSAAALLARHLTGDWGELDDHDRRQNEQARVDGSRLFSVYRLSNDTKVWVITEAAGDNGERASTCLLLPEEY